MGSNDGPKVTVKQVLEGLLSLQKGSLSLHSKGNQQFYWT